MKKKNELDDDDDLYAIENFFTVAKPTPQPSQAKPQTANGASTASAQTTANNVVRINSSNIPGVSIQKMLNDDGQKKETTAAVQITEACSPFSQKELNAALKEYIAQNQEKKIVISTIESTPPVLKEDFFIEIPVENSFQEREILNERPEMLSFLHKKLNNGKIRINVRMMEQKENKKMLSPMERMKSMMDRNENLKRLVIELNLELD